VKRCIHSFVYLLLALAMPASSLDAMAGPGAHGPAGEHLDQSGSPSGAPGREPRFEAATDLFEVVARFPGSELSMLIDRFDTNEPVVKARVEVESAGVKAEAKFHADQGDFATDDAALLAVLAKPGEHAVVIAITAGEHSDLLSGTLTVPDAAAPPTGSGPGQATGGGDHALEHAIEYGAIGAGVAFVLFLTWRMWRRRSVQSMSEVRQ